MSKTTARDRRSTLALTIVWIVALVMSLRAVAEQDNSTDTVERQSLDDAWWTGPIVAAGAGTLPQGHSLIEPYLYDVIRYGRYDSDGERQSVERIHSYGSLTYMLYGVTDNFTVGLLPAFGFNDVEGGSDSSAIQFGDLTVQAQYRLSQFSEGSWMPTTSLVVQETLPTGKYDQLGSNPNDGLGAGAYTTTAAFYSQYYFWMPNGRILRTRFNVSYAFSDDVAIEDESVYGTGPGFRGHAQPGEVLTLNSSWEYSITRNWVLALDLVYQHDESTHLSGTAPDSASGNPQRIEQESGSAWKLGIAPAIEYNWSPRIGLIVGVRWFGAGRNTSATLTPAIALNMVY